MSVINSNVTEQVSPENLPIFMCLLIDLPKDNIECSEKFPDKCVRCDVRSDYMTGEPVDGFGRSGHLFCLVIWILCVIIGMCGIVCSILIIAVLRRKTGSKKGFHYLLTVLAYFDLICCVMAVIASTCHVFYHENWSGRGITLLYIFYMSWISLLFGRTGSQFMTVAITVERWLVLTYPFRSRVWFTSTKTKLSAVAVIFVAILLSIPRSTSRYVSANIYNGQEGFDIPCLRDLQYYIRSTRLTKFWYKSLGSVHYQIDFWLPLPLYLIFTFMSFWQVRKMTLRRNDMNTSEKKEIQAVRMFLPVVMVLVICNLGPISMFVMVHFFKVLYREVYITTIFFICLTSSVNFLIYYFRGSSFRNEANAMLQECIKFRSKVSRVKDSVTTRRFTLHSSLKQVKSKDSNNQVFIIRESI